MNLVIPLAGKDPNYQNVYKPFIQIGDKTLIELILSKHQLTKNDKLIFITLKEYEETYNVTKKLQHIFGKSIIVRTLQDVTQGAPCSIMEAARDLIDNKTDLLIELADVLRDLKQFYNDIRQKKENIAGIIPITKRVIKDKPWGYIYLSSDGKVQRLQEKENNTFSPLASMGLYYFSQGNEFVRATQKMIYKKSFLYKDSYFVGPVYNELIEEGKEISISNNKIDYVLGNPYDIKYYRLCSKIYSYINS